MPENVVFQVHKLQLKLTRLSAWDVSNHLNAGGMEPVRLPVHQPGSHEVATRSKLAGFVRWCGLPCGLLRRQLEQQPAASAYPRMQAAAVHLHDLTRLT